MNQSEDAIRFGPTFNPSLWKRGFSLLPLSSVDKYFLAYESDRIHFNSHFTIDLENEIDIEKLKAGIMRLAREIPLARSFVVKNRWSFKRYAADEPWFDSHQLLEQHSHYDPEAEMLFCSKPFNLERHPPLRFRLTRNESGQVRFISSVHHSACDGFGHLFLLEYLFHLMDGTQPDPAAKDLRPFRFRWFFLRKGIFWSLRQALKFVRPFGRKKRSSIATLIDYPNNVDRSVQMQIKDLASFEIDRINRKAKALEMTQTEYLTYIGFQVLDRMMQKRGDSVRPLRILLPVNHRPQASAYLKSFQNILGMALVDFQRDEILERNFSIHLRTLMKDRSQLEETSQLIFYSGFFTTLLPPSFLQSYYDRVDRDPNLIFGSLLINSGRIPSQWKSPRDWKVSKIYGRTALLKSPGIAIMTTRYRDTQVLLFEYVNGLFKSETIQEFIGEFSEALL